MHRRFPSTTISIVIIIHCEMFISYLNLSQKKSNKIGARKEKGIDPMGKAEKSANYKVF